MKPRYWVIDQNDTFSDTASAIDSGLSTMMRWVRQLHD